MTAASLPVSFPVMSHEIGKLNNILESLSSEKAARLQYRLPISTPCQIHLVKPCVVDNDNDEEGKIRLSENPLERVSVSNLNIGFFRGKFLVVIPDKVSLSFYFNDKGINELANVGLYISGFADPTKRGVIINNDLKYKFQTAIDYRVPPFTFARKPFILFGRSLADGAETRLYITP